MNNRKVRGQSATVLPPAGDLDPGWYELAGGQIFGELDIRARYVRAIEAGEVEDATLTNTDDMARALDEANIIMLKTIGGAQ